MKSIACKHANAIAFSLTKTSWLTMTMSMSSSSTSSSSGTGDGGGTHTNNGHQQENNQQLNDENVTVVENAPNMNDSVEINTVNADGEDDEQSHQEQQQVDEETTAATSAKCLKCGKKARKGCTQNVCVKCCTDFTNCEVHIEQRAQALWRTQVRDGTTPIQLQAKQERSKCLQTTTKKCFYREPGFAYWGDTVMIWNIHEYLANDSWKKDALRKSNKRRARFDNGVGTRLRNSKRRFRRIIQDLYDKQQRQAEDAAQQTDNVGAVVEVPPPPAAAATPVATTTSSTAS